MNHAQTYLAEAVKICELLPAEQIEAMASALASLKEAGRSPVHFRCWRQCCKLRSCGQRLSQTLRHRSLCSTDNVSEQLREPMTKVETVFSGWLKIQPPGNPKDALLILSVGGGNADKHVSVNLVHTMNLLKERGAKYSASSVVTADTPRKLATASSSFQPLSPQE